MIGPMLRVLVVALIVLVALMLAIPRPERAPVSPADAGAIPTENATVYTPPRPLPDFELTDVDGRPFTKASFEDRFSLVFFGFTNCPDVCPITLQVLAAAVERLEADAPDAVPTVVFVSVDPFRDTPERIRAYLSGFDPSFEGVTGPDERLEPLLRALGVHVEKHEHHGEQYNVVHSGVVFFVGPRAEVLAISSPPNKPSAIASDYLAVRNAYLERGPTSAEAQPAP